MRLMFSSYATLTRFLGFDLSQPGGETPPLSDAGSVPAGGETPPLGQQLSLKDSNCLPPQKYSVSCQTHFDGTAATGSLPSQEFDFS